MRSNVDIRSKLGWILIGISALVLILIGPSTTLPLGYNSSERTTMLIFILLFMSGYILVYISEKPGGKS